MAIALSHGGTTIFSGQTRSNEVLVGTKEGIVFIERDGSGDWRITDRALNDSHVSSIIFEPENALIVAGAFEGAVWVSTDGGTTWERRDNGITAESVYCVSAIDQGGKVRLFAGTEPAHLFYSDDLGYNWVELPNLRSIPGVDEWTFPAPPHIAHTKHINFHPADPSTMFVSVEVGTLLKSSDAGQTWEDLMVPYHDVHRSVIHPQDPDRIYVTGGDGLYTSFDGGGSWEHWTLRTDDNVGGYPDLLVFRPCQPELMFMGAAHENPGTWRESHFAGARISRSTDGGRTWEPLRGGLPDRLQSSIEAISLEDHGDSYSLFVGTTAGEVWNSEDGGDTWTAIITGLAPISKSGHFRPLVTA